MRVLGEFPPQSEDSLIALSWVEAAQQRQLPAEGETVIGCDCARYGCFDDRTEILTDDGWKLFENLTGEEQVLTLNGDRAEWGPITEVHRYPFDGFLNLYDGAKVNFCITDNHRLVAKGELRRKKWQLRRYDELPQRFGVRRTNEWQGQSPEQIIFRWRRTMPHGGEHTREWTFDFLDWARFLGWFVSEGNVYQERRKGGRLRILIAQMPGEKREAIRALLDRMGIVYREIDRQFEFSNKEIGQHLIDCCQKGAHNKRVPRYIREATPAVMEAFLETFRLGDGSVNGGGTRSYSTSSKNLADDIHEMLVKLGKAGKMRVQATAGTVFRIGDRMITRHHATYTVTERQHRCDSDIVKAKVQRIRYQGTVHCVSTPLKTIMVRRNGCTMWSGNSDESVAYVRQGPAVIAADYWRKRDLMETTGRLVALAQTFAADRIQVDDIGMGGGVTDRLLELRRAGEIKAQIVPVNVAETGEEPERYINRRAKIHFALAERLKKGLIDLPEEDASLVAQLTNQRYRYTSAGKYQLESKEDMKKRKLPSPDRADALALTFASAPRPENPLAGIVAQGRASGWNPRS